MASGTIKLRSKSEGGVAEIKALISHPMEGGGRKDKATGEMVPAHFIQEVVAELNGKPVMTALWGGGVSKNPFLAFKVKANAGDTVKLSWKDNKGDSDTVEAKIA
jgi:sulfur-oxidizing protein SoxZ